MTILLPSSPHWTSSTIQCNSGAYQFHLYFSKSNHFFTQIQSGPAATESDPESVPAATGSDPGRPARVSLFHAYSHVYIDLNFWYRFSHRAIQLINRAAPVDGGICYPLGVNQAALHALAHTVREATNINGMC